jgi:hypothetical protein
MRTGRPIGRLRGTVKLAAGWVAWAARVGHGAVMMTSPKTPDAGHRFPPEPIGHAAWLYLSR